MAPWLSTLNVGGDDEPRPNSSRKREKYTASLEDSEAAMISASHDESAIVGCFFELQPMAARPQMKTLPDMECLRAQSESEYPANSSFDSVYRRPR